jgi:hypothetical protein
VSKPRTENPTFYVAVAASLLAYRPAHADYALEKAPQYVY